MFSIASRLLALAAAAVMTLPLLPSQPLQAQDLDANQRQQLYYRAKPAVVLVHWQAQMEIAVDGRRFNPRTGGAGSGWIITPDGYVITNGHVILGYHDRLITQRDLIGLALQEAGLLQGLSEAEQAEVINESLPDNLRSELGLTPVRPRSGGAGASGARGARGQQAPAQRRVPEIQMSPVVLQLAVVLQNGRQYPADVRAYSPPMGVIPGKISFAPGSTVQSGRDVAVLKISGSDLPVVKLGDSERVELGATVHAAGYPGVVSNHPLLGETTRLQASFTEGRISSLKMDVEGASLLQMSAPTSWGNSGGPVFNDKGEVIGMTTLGSIARMGSINQSVQGFNFAVPVNTVREFVQQAGVDLSKESLFTRVWERALDQYFAGRHNEATSDFNRALSLMPGFPDAERLRRFSIDATERGITPPPVAATEPPPAGEQAAAPLPVEQPAGENSWPWLVGGLLALALVLVPVGLVMRRRAPARVVQQGSAQRSLPGSGQTGHLVVSSGPHRGNRIAIPIRGLTIGRDPSRNQLVLTDDAVSRTHALVIPSGEEAGLVVVRNLSQTNPTYVNDQPVEEVKLRAGDRIKVGNSVIIYESE